MKKYKYLEKYICKQKDSNGVRSNSFFSINSEEIIFEEKKIEFDFPMQLKDFWSEIGYGFFHLSKNGKIQNTYSNRLLPPDEIKEILLSDEDDPNCPVIYEFYENLTEGDMPFFEIGDSVSFLYMRPKSDKPNAVYDALGNEISPTFEEFIYKLYHVSPTFYIDEFNKK